MIKLRTKVGGKFDDDGTDRPETSGRFTEAKRFSPISDVTAGICEKNKIGYVDYTGYLPFSLEIFLIFSIT